MTDDDILLTNSTDTEYPPEDTLGDQWLRGSGSEQSCARRPLAYSGTEWYDRVSRLAYHLYLRRGQVHGHDVEDWLAAEHIVLSQLHELEDGDGDESNGQST